MASWMRAIAAAAPCVVLLAGCASPEVDRGAPAGDGFHLAQIERAWSSQPSSIAIERVTAPPLNEYDWTVASVDPASDLVEVAWTDGGSLQCGEVDRLQVDETERAVIIGVAATHRDPQLNCTLEGYQRTRTVQLRHPLGRRALMEGATGIHDGLPKVSSPTSLPDPVCSAEDGSASDVPVGMTDVTTHMAPAAATKAIVCRTWWPRGNARSASLTISGPAKVRALVAAIDGGSSHLQPAAPSSRCDGKDVHASVYAVTLLGPDTRVEVRTDAISCDTITNGAASGTMTPALEHTLDALFTS